MKIYLKHTDRKQFICLTKQESGTIEVDIFHNGRDFDMSYSVYEDEQPDERHSYYVSQHRTYSRNGKWSSTKEWEKSNKAEFMRAFASAQNTLLTFNQAL